jgi:hypothetical protein
MLSGQPDRHRGCAAARPAGTRVHLVGWLVVRSHNMSLTPCLLLPVVAAAPALSACLPVHRLVCASTRT